MVMPLYNAERYVEEAIRSVLNQSYANLELIIVDDKSKDLSLDVARRFDSDSRVRILTNTENRGIAYTRNKGIKHSNGEVIAFLDADDIYHPDKLELQIQQMSTEGHLKDEVVYTDYFKLNDEGRILRYSNPEREVLKGNMVGALLKEAGFIGAYASMICLRESALEVGLFDEALKTVSDLDFALKLAKTRPFIGILKPLYGYRIQRNSITHTTSVPERYRVRLKVMEKHLRLNPEVSKGDYGPEIRRQIAKCLIITRSYKSALVYTLNDPRIFEDFYYWFKRR